MPDLGPTLAQLDAILPAVDRIRARASRQQCSFGMRITCEYPQVRPRVYWDFDGADGAVGADR